MLKYKSLHKSGLDFKIYNLLKNEKCNKNYYLYIYDYAVSKCEIYNFYNEDNNNNNTWNYSLKYNSTKKDNIMKD